MNDKRNSLPSISTDSRLKSNNQPIVNKLDNDIPSNYLTTRSYSNVAKLITKEQAVTFLSLENTKLQEYIITLGNIIGPKKMLSASRISKNRICIYLDSVDTLNSFICTHKGITIKNQFLPAEKFVKPSRKLILSNIHTCIPNKAILDALVANNITPVSSLITCA